MANTSNLLLMLGKHFREAREHAGLTQEEVANRAGISRFGYREIENGASAPRATTLVNIARALGMEMMLIPQQMVPAVEALLRPAADDDRPAFTADPEDEERHDLPRSGR